jgi:hypothetical protein
VGDGGFECLAGGMGGEPNMTGRALLLSPSRGLEGGIDRYVETLDRPSPPKALLACAWI